MSGNQDLDFAQLRWADSCDPAAECAPERFCAFDSRRSSCWHCDQAELL